MPGPVYIPSLMVKLRVRFDEALHGVDISAPESLEDGGPQGGAQVSTVSEPALMVGRADQLSTLPLPVCPLKAHIEIPGYRQAAKFTMVMPWRDFPFEPDVVRAVGVEIFAGCVDATEFGKGMTTNPGQTRRTSQLLLLDESTEVFYGLADTIRVEHNSEHGDVIHLEGRDLRGIMRDMTIQVTMLSELNVTKPIHNVIQQLIDRVPLLKEFKKNTGDGVHVYANASDWPGNAIPAPNDPDVITRVQQGAAGADESNPSGPANSLQVSDPTRVSVWDLVVNFCNLVGAVPYFVGRALYVRPATALYDDSKLSPFDPRFKTPFAGRKPRTIQGEQGSDLSTSIRVLTYGRDLIKLSMERKLGGVKVPGVRVISYNSDSKDRGAKGRLLDVRWPPIGGYPADGLSATAAKKALSTSVSPSGVKVQSEYILISRPGIKSEARLLQIAKSIFNEVGRGEIHGSAATKDLASLGGDATDPDLLKLRPGDPVRFEVDNRALTSYPPAVAGLPELLRLAPDQLAQRLGDLLGDQTAGRVLAYSLKNQIKERQRTFRVTNVRFSWDSQKGMGVDFDYQNYIEARSGAGSTANRSAASPQTRPTGRAVTR